MAYNLYPDDELAPDRGSAVAFDEPDAEGTRYPLAIPQGGSWQPQAGDPGVRQETPEFSPLGNRYVPGSENMRALPGGGVNQAYAAEQLRQQFPDLTAIKAQENAIRFQGLQEYQNLVDGGASPSEATRLAGPKLFFNHPGASTQMVRGVGSGLPPKVTTQEVPGGNAIFDASGRLHSVLRTPAPPREIKPVMPLDQKTAIDNAKSDVATAQKALAKAKTDTALLDKERPAAIAAAEQALSEARGAQSNIVNSAMGRSAPKQPESEMVRVTSPDGKMGSIPRSKLEAAKKAGYKER